MELKIGILVLLLKLAEQQRFQLQNLKHQADDVSLYKFDLITTR